MSCPQVITVVTPGPPGIGLPAGTADAGKFLQKDGTTPYLYRLIAPDAIGLPQALGVGASPEFAELTLSGLTANRLVFTGTGGALAGLLIGSGLAIVDGALTATAAGGAVSLVMPTGFSVSGSGTSSLSVSFAAEYSLPTTAKQGNWDTAYSDRLNWNGGPAGLNAATGRASLDLGTAATTDATAYATAAQGALADLAIQPGDSPALAGLTITGTAPVLIPHIHGNLAGRVYQHVRAGVSLAALAPYHVVDSQGDTDRVLVVAARGDTVASMPASGVLAAALATNDDGDGVVAGVITGVNTAGLTSGDPVYVGLAGGLTATRPTTGLVQVVAVVGRVHATTGTLAVLVGPALPPLAYSAAYADLSGTPSIPSPADAAPAALAATAAIGSSTDYALEDHAHQRDTDLLVVNLSGSQSDPTAANGIEMFTFQWPAQILASALSADTAASGSAFQVNARLNASSIYSVRPQIAVGSTTGSSGTLAITTAAAGDVLRFDISQAGGGCRLAKLYLTVRRNDA